MDGNGFAAKLLCERVTENFIKELILINEDYEGKKSAGNYLMLSKADSKFHSKIFESCGNKRLAWLVSDLHIITKSFRSTNNIENIPKGAFNTPYTHFKIIDAIKSGNVDRAERTARRHVEWTKENMIKNVIEEGI